MKNNFAEEYKKNQECVRLFDAASCNGDKDGMDAARNAHYELTRSIEAKGNWYARLFAKYSEAMECGNERISWNDPLTKSDAEELVKALRQFGIEEIVFSSGWTDANDAAWVFTQNGCKLLGMVEINSSHKSFGRKDYDKVHGYLFEL